MTEQYPAKMTAATAIHRTALQGYAAIDRHREQHQQGYLPAALAQPFPGFPQSQVKCVRPLGG